MRSALLWVVGPLLRMPAELGMPLFTVNAMAVQSLIGHLVIGLVHAAVVVALVRRMSHLPRPDVCGVAVSR